MSDLYDDVYADDKVDGPHIWIQWKGTDLCADVHCKCGAHDHIDAEFAYFYECRACGRKYALAQNLRLIPLTPEQAAQVERFVTADG